MKRSLSNVGGPVEISGDAEAGRVLAQCLDVDPQAPLRFTHGFHAYPARMHPETARRVIEAFKPKSVLDPFMGSGTVAVEALRYGAAFTGTDVLRVAVEIAWVRTRVLSPGECRRIETEGAFLTKLAAKGLSERFDLPDWAERERDWYSPHTLREIVLLKHLIDQHDLKRLFTVVLSSILVKLSKQISDSVSVPDRDFKPWPPLAAFRLFRDKCRELGRRLAELSADLQRRKVTAVEPDLRLEDARTARFPPVELVLTSPPYPGTYDYAYHHARRLAIFGESEFALKHEIGSRREGPKAYREQIKAVLDNLPRTRTLLLVGDSRNIKTDVLLRELAPVKAVASQRRRDWTGNKERKREHLILIER